MLLPAPDLYDPSKEMASERSPVKSERSRGIFGIRGGVAWVSGSLV